MRTLTLRIALSTFVVTVFAVAASPASGQAVTCDFPAATITGTTGDDIINGTPGNDVIYGLDGNDTIAGGDGHDLICGGMGNDTIAGGSGNDAIDGSAGNDLVDGGGGSEDAAVYTAASGSVTIDLTTGTASGAGIDTDALIGIEDATGSAHADAIFGNALSNYLDGRGGHDDVRGLSGLDYLDGDEGNDRLDGGPGPDLAVYFFAPQGVRASLARRQATGWGTDQLLGFEAIQGSRYADVLTGNGASNFLFGSRGNDRLNGLGGPDRLFGEAGRDRLDGGRGRDFGNGGTGIDVCISIEQRRRCP